MKRFGIPLLVIALVATAAYAWRSSVTKHEFVEQQALSVAQRGHAALLSLPSKAGTVDRVNERPTIQSRSHATADTLHPEDFSERSVPKYNWESSDEHETSYLNDTTHKNEDGDILYLVDTATTIREYYERSFVDYTVMKMLFRHVANPIAGNEFSRCPSGYYFVHGWDYRPELDSAIQHPVTDPWHYGSVYFGEGCSDSLLYKYRIQYSSRIVEMKDPRAADYVSLGTYERMKFSHSMAAAIHVTPRER